MNLINEHLFPYQRTDVDRICNQWSDRSVFLGHEMGLGKTLILLACIEKLKATKVLVISPASVRMVIEAEARRWLPDYRCYTVVSSKLPLPYLASWRLPTIVIVSYDLAITPFIGAQLMNESPFWDLLAFDEAHCLGTPTSKRTKFCLGSLYPRAVSRNRQTKVIFMSGSIQRDKPINLWPIFRTLAPDAIPSYKKFIDRYVKTRETRYGLQFVGGKNLKELGEIARKRFLIRRTKEEVLPDLPAKLEQQIFLTLDDVDEQERLVAETQTQVKLVGIKNLFLNSRNLSDGLSTLRRNLGEAKVPSAISYALELLGLGSTDESCGKLVIFCYHRSVFNLLTTGLSKHLPVTGYMGGDALKERKKAVDEFQNGNAKVFVATFAAAEGITLTAASTCLFAEMSWSLAQNDQAQDRLHRIGQHHPVYVKYLLLSETLDEIVYRTYKRKQKDKDAVLIHEIDGFSDGGQIEQIAGAAK